MIKILKPFLFHLSHFIKTVSRPSTTVQYPYVQRQMTSQARSKFRLDLDICTGCRACEEVCPTQSVGIQFVKDYDSLSESGLKNVQQLSIDYGSCINCGWCVDVCEPKALVFDKKKQELGTNRQELVDRLVKIKTLPHKRV